MLLTVLWDVRDRPPQQGTVRPKTSIVPTLRNPDLDTGTMLVSHLAQLGWGTCSCSRCNGIESESQQMKTQKE